MHIIWAILGLVFLYLDLKKTSILKLTCAASFMFCAIVSYKLANPIYQFISLPIFLLVFYALIKIIKNKEISDIKKELELKDYLNKTAIVKKDIGKTLSIDGIGYIEFNNKLWEAKSIDDKEIKAGKTVEIVSKENMIMNVKVVENAKN